MRTEQEPCQKGLTGLVRTLSLGMEEPTYCSISDKTAVWQRFVARMILGAKVLRVLCREGLKRESMCYGGGPGERWCGGQGL